MTQRERLNKNIEAIVTALEIFAKENNFPTEEQLEKLRQFQGWGGIKSFLYPIDINWVDLPNISAEDLKMETLIKDFHQLISVNFPDRYDEIVANIKEATLTSFYTPQEIPDVIFQKLYENNTEVHSFLEPSAGSGIYIDSFLDLYPHCERVVGVEKDYLTALILQAKYRGNSNVIIHNKGFEEIVFKEKFDAIASNIPFGNFKIHYPEYSKNITDKIHNFFFYHAQKLLNKGGFLSFITSSGVFNSQENISVRQELELNGEIQNLITLPNNTFEGTEVTAQLFNYINTGRLSADLIAESFDDEQGIQLNQYVHKYFDTSFLAMPQLGTNPYGTLEYQYKLPMAEIISELDNRLFFPHLQIEYPISIDNNQELDFFHFENVKMSTIHSIQDQLKFVRSEVIDKEDFRLLGVIKGKYKGKVVPFASISKSGEEYLLDVFVKNDIFKTKFKGFEPQSEFKEKFPQFLDELTKICSEHQIKIDTDFRRITEGFNFYKYVEKRYQKPILDTFYITQDEVPITYHRELEVNDISFTENKNPAIIETIETLEFGQKLYKIKEIEVTPQERDYIRRVFGVYNVYNELNVITRSIQKEEKRKILSQEEKVTYQKKIQEKVQELNKRYDEFVSKFGYFNEQRNKRLDKYLSSYFPIVKALENPTGNLNNLFSESYEKADIFKYEYIFSNDKLYSVKSGLIKSLQDKNKVDLAYIAELSLNSVEEIKAELEELITYNPIHQNFELKEQFLSGNLYKKIEQVESLPDSFSKNNALELLQSALPDKIPFVTINRQLGSRWIPNDVINDFIEEYYNTKFDIFVDVDTDVFFAKSKGSRGMKYVEHKCINGRYIRSEDIVENAYNDTYPIVTYTIEHSNGEKEKKTDEPSTLFYKREIAKLKRAFVDYCLNLPNNKKEQLENIYNRIYNNSTKLVFESNLLDFSSIDLEALGIDDMYAHQKQAVWKMVQNHGGIVDHEVGFGKTLTMIGLGSQFKQMGIAKKPMIIGLKANIGEIAHTYKKAFPNGKILFATEKDYEKKNREVFLNRIKTNNWDIIIMSHTQFQSIPQNPEIELQVLNQELSDITNNLIQAINGNFSKKQLRQLEVSKKNLEVKIKFLQEKQREQRDKNVLNFEDLGIDHIIVDESHEFKNLGFQTRHTRVAGLGNTEGSQMAMNLLMAIRSIQRNTPGGNGGASLFSGTPISNSLTELYLLHKYLTPNELKEKRISNFDAWAANFAIKSIDFEANMVNEIVAKERFRYFVNLPELSQMYTQTAHVMNGNTSIIDRPQKNEELLLNEQTPLQKRFFVKLAKFLKNKNPEILNLDRPINLDSKGKALSIIAMDLAFKASLDMRLINGSYPDDPDSKINTLLRKVLDTYHKFDEQKGTQIIFCDTSTSKKKLSYKEMDYNYKNNVFTSVYDDVKYKLIRSGIPEEEIAFVQDYSNSSKKELLSEKMRKGEIRFLLGGTQNAGTGLNVQDRLCHIAHLTIPWKPSELDQRNGRGWRKKNWIAKNYNNNTIDISICGTARTLDNYRIDLIKNKAKFISQIRSSANTNQRIADEGEMSEDSGMNLAEFQAQLSGDTSLLDRHKIEKQIKELEGEKAFFYNQKIANEKAIETCQKRDVELDKIIEIIAKDLELYEQNVRYDAKGMKINNPIYEGLNENASNEEIASFLKKEWDSIRKMEEGYSKVIGSLYGFELVMENRFMGAVAYARNPQNPKITYDSTKGIINFDGTSTAKSYYMNCLANIERRSQYNISERAENIQKLESLQKKTISEFEKEDILKKLYEEKERLDIKIKSGQKNAEILPYVEKIIGGESYNIPIVNDVAVMEKALLQDLLGTPQSKMKAILTDSKVVEILEKLERTGSVEIQNHYFDKDQKKEYIRFKIENEDILYSDFVKELKESTQSIVEEPEKKYNKKI